MLKKPFTLKITPEAIVEIQGAVYYYNSKRKGLGREFLMELKQDFARIKRNPYSCSVKYDDVRWASMKRFPYAAHYTITEESNLIIVQAVLSHHQNPDTNWKKRQ